MVLCSIKRFFGNFKPSKLRKLAHLSRKIKPYFLEVKPELDKDGFKRIKPCNKSTWKFYGDNKVRFTLSAIKESKKVIIKIARGFDDKMDNSIIFQKRFNSEFDFIPKGTQVILNGFKCYFTECIDYTEMSSVIKESSPDLLNYFLTQVNQILDELNKYKIVHCDLEEVNILIEKKSHKLFLIDWDTVCSASLGLNCVAFPNYTIKKRIDNRIIYDDAYSFSVIFKRYVKPEILDDSPLFKNIEEKIGRNIHLVNKQ